MHIIISSHILHEVDMISDGIVMMSNGYVVAEGDIRGVRSEMDDHPLQILIRCNRSVDNCIEAPFWQDSVVEVKLHSDGHECWYRREIRINCYMRLNRIVLENDIAIEAIRTCWMTNIHSVYQYLVREVHPEW